MPPALPPDPLAPLAGLAQRLADAARPIILAHFRRRVAVEDKADASPVTVADRGAEAAMRAILATERPQDGILGEEEGAARLDAEWVWVIDPIDGTKSFICGVPLFGTLIALLYRGRPVVGIIDHPALGQRWLGVAGEPTRMNDVPVTLQPPVPLAQSRLFSTAPEMFPPDLMPRYLALRGAVKLPRYGADCYAFGLLASGLVDIVCEASLKPYDVCALVPVIEGAGGIISDWAGRPLGLEMDGTCLAARTPALHKEALARLGA